MKFSPLAFSVPAALSVFSGTEARANDVAAIAVIPTTGAITLGRRWTVGGKSLSFSCAIHPSNR